MRTYPHRRWALPAGLRQRRRHGTYSVMLGLTFTLLLGFSGLAIDAAYIRLADLQCQAAADAGAHAALVYLKWYSEGGEDDLDDARDAAREVINENWLLGQSADIDPDKDIVFGEWDFEDREFDDEGEHSNAVQVTVRKTASSPNGAINTLVARVFGPEHAAAAARDTAIGALRFREIVIAQDVTGSFMDEIDDARDADLAFLDYLWAHRNPGDRIGMIQFVGEAADFTPLSYLDKDADYEAVYDQWETITWCNRDYGRWTKYAPSWPYHQSDMMDCNAGIVPVDSKKWDYDSGTDQADGLDAALDLLLSGSSDDYAVKTIVLVSDGKAECSKELTGSAASACEATIRTRAQAVADEAEDEGVAIFSVSLNTTYDATQSAFLESLIRGYGRFYETPDSTELPEILEEIAKSIPIALVK